MTPRVRAEFNAVTDGFAVTADVDGVTVDTFLGRGELPWRDVEPLIDCLTSAKLWWDAYVAGASDGTLAKLSPHPADHLTPDDANWYLQRADRRGDA
jgi:hypothetical protein